MNPMELVTQVTRFVARFRDAQRRGLFGREKLFVAAAQGLTLFLQQTSSVPTKPLSPNELAVLRTASEQLRQMGALLAQTRRGTSPFEGKETPEGALVDLIMAILDRLEALEKSGFGPEPPGGTDAVPAPKLEGSQDDERDAAAWSSQEPTEQATKKVP
jgi:hypothetical protein